MEPVLGILLALVAAAAIASTVVFIRVGTTSGKSLDALAVVLLVNIVLLIPPTLYYYYPDYSLTGASLLSFAAAGLVGTMLGRAFFYTGIKRVGASRSEPIKATQPLHASIIAVIFLGETVTSAHAVGIVLIVVGVALVSWESTRSPEPDDRVALAGLAFPIVASICYGLEPIFATVGFEEGTPVLVGLSIKTLAATIAFLAYLRWRDALPARAAFTDGNLKWYLAAGVGNTVFLLAYYAALEIAPVVIVVPVMQVSPLIVALLSLLFLRHLERITVQFLLAVAVIVVGTTLVSLAGSI